VWGERERGSKQESKGRRERGKKNERERE